MIHEKHVQWLEARGISAELAEKFGLKTVLKKGANWLAVPYVEDGQTVNHKYRLTSQKRHMLDPEKPLILWNIDCLNEESERPVVICEGEWDALTAISLGWRAVSVPNGAPSEQSLDVANAKRYDFMWAARDKINRVHRFIIATDEDDPGRCLRRDLATLIGADRCSFVEYPFPCKDLNEVLVEYGKEAVAKVLNSAKPFPVKGLYRFSDFPELPPVRGLSVGIDCLEGKIELVPGTLTVMTGYSNIGKSTVLNTVIASAIMQRVTVCVAAFETMPRPILRDAVARAIIGCSEHEFANHPKREETYALIEERLLLISNALDEELEFDIDTFLERVGVAVHRDGARMIVVDPWNELEHKRNRDESLTEYVGRAIRSVKRFARVNNVSFWIVAHPSKPMKGTNTMPSLYDISDSAHWANKPDYGLVYHRKDKAVNEGQLAVVKVRMGLPGYCCCETVKFDHRTGRITGYTS